MSKLQLRNHGPLNKKLKTDEKFSLVDAVGLTLHPTDAAMPVMAQMAISWLFGEAVKADEKGPVIFSIVNFVGCSYKKNKAFPEDMEPIDVGFGKVIAEAFVEAFVDDFSKSSSNAKDFVPAKEQVGRLKKGERFLYRGYFGGLKFECYISVRDIMIAPPVEPVEGEEPVENPTAFGYIIELKVG